MFRTVRRCNASLPHAFRAALNISNSGSPSASASASLSLSLAKIVATIGPASEQRLPLQAVQRAGLAVMRINFSHATFEEADLRTCNLNGLEDSLSLAVSPSLSVSPAASLGRGARNMSAIMLDTQGPEIRTGSFGGGIREVEVAAGQRVVLCTDSAVRTAQTESPCRVWISYAQLQRTAGPGSVILLDDGAIALEVVEHQGGDIVCTALNGGTLGNKKGVNMPNLKVELPAMSKKDEHDIRWGIENDIDMIAASFVRKPSDVEHIRAFCAQVINELTAKDGKQSKGRVIPKIISKIESTEGLQNFDAILDISDGIMVARGDLGVEIPMETLPAVQKEIVRRCRFAGKPVIVATQMLESMQKNPRPTRAEALDVANAVLDGADCVMLSGESAKGKYPVESVATMNRIIMQTELSRKVDATVQSSLDHNQHPISMGSDEALAFAAVKCSKLCSDCVAIVVNIPFKNDGQEVAHDLPMLIAKYQPNVPIFLAVPTYKAGRLLQVYRGMKPVLSNHTPASFLQQLKEQGALLSGPNSKVVHVVLDGESNTPFMQVVDL